MEYKLVKKLVKLTNKKDGKETIFLNFYLINKEDGLLIPIEVKAFKDKNGKVTPRSRFAWNLANQTAEWMYGSENKKDSE